MSAWFDHLEDPWVQLGQPEPAGIGMLQGHNWQLAVLKVLCHFLNSPEITDENMSSPTKRICFFFKL